MVCILDTINDVIFEDGQKSFKNEERKRSVFNERMRVFKRITEKNRSSCKSLLKEKPLDFGNVGNKVEEYLCH